MERNATPSDLELVRRKFGLSKTVAARSLAQPIYDRPELSRNPLGAPQQRKPESHPVPALDQKPKARRSRQGRLAVVVTLLSCRVRELDSDNLQASFKGLRDAVAKSLGVDDADKRVRWQYGQIESRGEPGTIVMIETVPDSGQP